MKSNHALRKRAVSRSSASSRTSRASRASRVRQSTLSEVQLVGVNLKPPLLGEYPTQVPKETNKVNEVDEVEEVDFKKVANEEQVIVMWHGWDQTHIL